MVIRIRDLVPGADTADQGGLLLPALDAAMAAGTVFTVSFAGIQTATSSFVNVSFVALLNKYPLAAIKQRMRVTNSTRQINEMIRTRMQRAALEAAA